MKTQATISGVIFQEKYNEVEFQIGIHQFHLF